MDLDSDEEDLYVQLMTEACMGYRQRSCSVAKDNADRSSRGEFVTTFLERRKNGTVSDYIRLNNSQFDTLLGKLEHLISRERTATCPISAAERLAVTLRWEHLHVTHDIINFRSEIWPASICTSIFMDFGTCCCRFHEFLKILGACLMAFRLPLCRIHFTWEQPLFAKLLSRLQKQYSVYWVRIMWHFRVEMPWKMSWTSSGTDGVSPIVLGRLMANMSP